MRKCIKCKKKIPQERLKALPDTKTCVRCSEVSQKLGVMVWDQATPQLAIVDEEEAKEFWRAEQGEGRLSRL